MYRAKQIPGSATVSFHPDMRALAESQSRLHNELRRAPERGQLRAVYQPIVDLLDGRVRGVEALLRWRHPDLGDVPADVTVAAAERIGMAWDLTCWIAREAATAVCVWNTSNPGHAPLRLAVNFTPLLLDDPHRVAEFAAQVTDTGLPFELLDVELTETAFADHTPDVLASIAELRRLGARLAMDDFGTGYSSLIALSNLPLDILKIDRSFVAPLDNGGDSLLVSAMTFIAKGRVLETIAEGIETVGQLVALIAAGCDFGQGYLFSKPLEVEQLQGLAPHEPGFAELVHHARLAALIPPRASVAALQPTDSSSRRADRTAPTPRPTRERSGRT
jgi:EAL domain-containing protein (putative c-di-GMP-specific phosphodiesterase class I)